MPGLANTADQAKQFWATRNSGQKAFLAGGAAATILLVVFFVRLIGTPDYKPLFTNLEPADAQSLTSQLDAQAIPHQTSADGKTISVPADKLDAARMQTASQGDLHSGHMGFELFDKMSWGQTEFDEKVTYQRALEGELERSIETLADVESARVHLVMPTDSVFLDQQRAAKASVVLKLRRGVLSKDAVLAISNLVAGAVDELKPQDVSIVDADTDQELGMGQQNTGDPGAGQGTTLSDRLVSTLEPVVGVGKIRANVNVQYDQSTTDENDEKYDPSVSALLTDQKSDQESGGSSVPAGVPGTASNVATGKEKPASPVSTQRSTTENAQYGVNKTVVHTLTPAGRIQRITAAILVDDEVVRTVNHGKVEFTRRKRSQQELDEIRDLTAAAIGFDAKRGDTISVQDMPFDTDVVNTEFAPPTWTAKVQKTVLDYSSILRPASLLVLFLLVYLFILRPVQKHVLATAQLPAGAEPALENPQMEAGVHAPELPGAGRARAALLKEQTAEMIRQKPVHTARAVQAWLREEPS
ncbi:MAG TPA: flagellar basal-body MS-ring/collar protein FliF [Acidobacteriaceae bacterium]|jgi:flagellar M-ring protein FliF|nr:flagellar basal-body MS-ring/collar protein FliF [Acidobacteriaceae bacterium]